MDLGRRGFLGLLGGALLAKVVGPKIITAPSDAGFKAAIKLPPNPVLNQYVPLEQFSAEMVRLVGENLKWLRLEQFHENLWRDAGYRLGHTVMLREPANFIPCEPFSSPEDMSRVILNPVCAVNITNHSGVELDPDGIDIERPFGEISARYLVPAAAVLAERIISAVRQNGGAKYLVTVDPEVRGELAKCVVAANDESKLSLRAMDYQWPITRDGEIVGSRRVLSFDILYGLGG